MNCPQCGNAVIEGDNFCRFCGQSITITCATCGAICQPSNAFCGKCGTEFTTAATITVPVPKETPANIAPIQHRPSVKVETLEPLRKHVTILFADMKGSTMLIEGLDPEEASEVIAPVLNEMLQVVYRYNGTIIHTLGDGLIAVFGAPESLEDHALRGCLAALSMQENVKNHMDKISIRVGLNSGEIFLKVVGDALHQEYDISGDNVNLAARMEQTAKSGSIQMTWNTFKLVENQVKVKALGSLEVKGFSQLIDVFELQKVKVLFATKQRPVYLPFLGREKELAQLQELLEQTKTGHGQAVGIVGEAGQGKSRLLYELKQSVAITEYKVLTTGGVSHMRQVPLFPIIEALKELLCANGGKITVEQLKPWVQEISVPYATAAILEFFGQIVEEFAWNELDPQLKRKYRLQTIVEVWLAAAKKQPILFIIDDLYWVDSETEVFVGLLLPRIEEAHLLLLITYRPEYHDHWAHVPHYTRIVLQPLAPNSEAAALDIVLGTDDSLTNIKAKLLATCAGNPFFLEEMVKSLINEKVLIGTSNHYQLNMTKLIEKIVLPESIIAVLQAKIDSLPVIQKQILSVASVIGEQFTYTMLAKLVDINPKELGEVLHELSRKQREYIYELRLYPEPELAFKHALIHEVVYNNLLKDFRQLLHLKILTILENIPSDGSLSALQLKAQHAYLAAAWNKAFTYLQESATRLFALNSHKLAADLYEKALAAAQHLERGIVTDEKVFHLHLDLAALYLRLGCSKEEERHVVLAKEIATRLGDPSRIIGANIVQALYYATLHEVKKTQDCAQQAITLLKHSPNRDSMLSIKQILTTTNFFLGRYQASQDYAKEILTSEIDLEYKTKWTTVPLRGFITVYASWGRAYAGVIAPAPIQDTVQSLLLATDTRQISLNVLYILCSIAYLYFYQGYVEEALPYLQRTLKYAIDLDMMNYTLIPIAALTCTHFRLNQQEEAKHYLGQTINISNTVQIPTMRVASLDLIAEGMMLAGEYRKAAAFVEEALLATEHSEFFGFRASLERVAAEIHLCLPGPDLIAIKKQLEHALQSAERLGMPAHVAHCHRVLAACYQQMHNFDASHREWRLAYELYEKLTMPYWMKQCHNNIL